MDRIQIQKDIKVELSFVLGDDDFFIRDNNAEKRMIAISLEESICLMYIVHLDADGYKWNNTHGTYALKVANDGIQYFDGCYWRYFDKKVQEQWSDYIAEKVLLEE